MSSGDDMRTISVMFFPFVILGLLGLVLLVAGAVAVAALDADAAR